MSNEALYHHGVKGMKWGVRRTPAQLGKGKTFPHKFPKIAKKEKHEDYESAHSSKKIREMSDAELKKRINRLQMEKQYSQLADTEINRGKRYVSNVVKAGTATAAATSTALTLYNNADKIKRILENMR